MNGIHAKKSTLHTLVAAAAVYVYAFQPPFIDKLYFLLLEIFLFILALAFSSRSLARAASGFWLEYVFIVLIVALVAIRDMATGEVVYLDRFIAWAFQSHGIGLAVALYLSNLNVGDEEDLPAAVSVAGLVAALLTLLLFLAPGIDSLYRSIQLDSIYDRYAGFDVRYRAYGVSENLTFTYGYLMGVFAGYFYLQSKHGMRYLLVAAMCLMSAGLNARIGFFPFIVMVVYGLTVHRMVRPMAYSSAIALLLVWYAGYSDFDTTHFGWVVGFFEDIYGVLSGGRVEDSTGAIRALFGDFLVWPQGLSEWFFGSGASLYLSWDTNSDIGYILQLNYAGLFFVAILLSYQVFASVRIFKLLGVRHWFPFVFVLSMVVLNFKGFLFAATPGGRVVFMLYIYYVLRAMRWRSSVKRLAPSFRSHAIEAARR